MELYDKKAKFSNTHLMADLKSHLQRLYA
ncbi:unnamed protein product [Linum tenue]|uniref:Uncharacterized protein n=1 Tax=Linum tenue TaxID=586396 RepID=A0AAV0LFU6_9ROSI|nr:unnamed protein product [Linum tenue]